MSDADAAHDADAGGRGSLRGRAEDLARGRRSDLSKMSADGLRALAHELLVHQVELDLQNQELREAQLELARARDRYADLYDGAPVGYLTLDRDGVVETANLTAAALLAVARSELVGQRLSKFVAPASHNAWHLHYRDLAEAPATCELEMQRAEGARLAARVETAAVHDADGAVRGCRVVLVDVTARVRAEEALRHAHDQLEARVAERTAELQSRTTELAMLGEAVAHMGEGVLITEDELDWPGPRIVFVNDTMCRITGYTAGELIGATPRVLQGPRTARADLDRLKSELAAGRPCRVELVNYRKDRTPYYAEVFVSPLFDGAGTRIHFVSVHRDISEHKALERARLEATRSAQRAEENERRALARDLHDSIAQLLALARIKLSELQTDVGGARRGARAKEVAALVEEAERRTRTLMLRLSPPTLDALGLGAAASELAEDVGARYGIEVTVADDGSAADLDRGHRETLYRGLRELLINAARHAHSPRARVRIEGAGPAVVVTVEDDGRGFDPQGATAGFGLVSLRERLDGLGGRLEVTSVPGDGTRARITMPRTNGAAEEGAP